MTTRRNLFLFLTGLALLGASLACGLAGSAPPLDEPSGAGVPQPAAAPTQALQPTSTAAVTQLPFVAGGGPLEPPPAILESRLVTLEFPARIRVGDSDVIRLTLEVNDLGGVTPTAEIAGNTVTGETVQIPNLYDTHNVTAEARLDMAGPEIRPSETISEPLLPGGSVTFYWSVRPQEAGVYRGTAWLHLRFVDRASGQESRRAVSAQPLQIEATSLFGLSANLARTAGGFGSVLGAILGFPFMDDVLKWLLRRRKSS